MSLWFKSGTETLVVNSSGNLVNCHQCPCDGFGVVPGCAECSGNMAQCWELTVAGVSNQDCTDCSLRNGTFTLSCSFCFCGRTSPTVTRCSESGDATGSLWALDYDGGTSEWTLSVASTGGTGFEVIYTISAIDFDCVGTNEFTFDSSNSSCTNWPSTLTITPVSCP